MVESIGAIASNIVTDLIEKHWSAVKGGSRKECVEYGSLLPIGHKWELASAYAYIATCSTGKDCDTTMTNALMNWGFNWADNAIDSYGDREDWKIGFSHSGNWHLCIRITRKRVYTTYAATVNAAKALGCPKGYCDGSSMNTLPHDELK